VSVIEVAELRRTYLVRRGMIRRSRQVIEALRGISFEAGEGEMIGLLGPNGAGKTTTIRILATLLLPDSGTARVLGYDVTRHPGEVRRRIGFLFGGERGLYGRVSAWANLRYFANLHGLPARRSSRRIDEMLETVGLTDRARDKVDTFSRGMKQRLHIARALLHEPRVLYVDEPTIGLDPVSAREIRAILAGLRDRGHTILLTTHYMAEAEELCDRVAVISGGRILTCQTPASLRRGIPEMCVVEVDIAGDLAEFEGVSRLDGVTVLAAEPRGDATLLRLQSPSGGAVVDALAEVLPPGRIRSTLIREPTLEDVYVRLVGEGNGAPS
jgi:ABC-2 type transport system ATP-binding protein